jgi:hypothetical protein
MVDAGLRRHDEESLSDGSSPPTKTSGTMSRGAALLAHPQVVALGFVVGHCLVEDVVGRQGLERGLDLLFGRIVIGNWHRAAAHHVRTHGLADFLRDVGIGGVGFFAEQTAHAAAAARDQHRHGKRYCPPKPHLSPASRVWRTMPSSLAAIKRQWRGAASSSGCRRGGRRGDAGQRADLPDQGAEPDRGRQRITGRRVGAGGVAVFLDDADLARDAGRQEPGPDHRICRRLAFVVGGAGGLDRRVDVGRDAVGDGDPGADRSDRGARPDERRAGAKRRAKDRRERDHLDETAFLEKERREPAAGGEKLRELAESAVREMHPDQRQDGAEAGIARRLAEPGKNIGKGLHDGGPFT